MRSFASDNNSGVHPLVTDALLKANVDHAVGYGDDSWTHAAEKKLKEVFGEKATPFFVFKFDREFLQQSICINVFIFIQCDQTRVQIPCRTIFLSYAIFNSLEIFF